jgi:maltose-binding protein MalE
VIAAQQAIVDAFNASQSDIRVVLEIVDNDQAYDVLATQIAAGNAPDIVGPMGIRGRSDFPGVWRDLSDLIDANDYDLSDFDPALVDFYIIEGQGQIGLPFAVFPSYITYNVDLFDEAGLPTRPAATASPTPPSTARACPGTSTRCATSRCCRPSTPTATTPPWTRSTPTRSCSGASAASGPTSAAASPCSAPATSSTRTATP